MVNISVLVGNWGRHPTWTMCQMSPGWSQPLMHVQSKHTQGSWFWWPVRVPVTQRPFWHQWTQWCSKPGDAAVGNKSDILTALPEIQMDWRGCPKIGDETVRAMGRWNKALLLFGQNKLWSPFAGHPALLSPGWYTWFNCPCWKFPEPTVELVVGMRNSLYKDLLAQLKVDSSPLMSVGNLSRCVANNTKFRQTEGKRSLSRPSQMKFVSKDQSSVPRLYLELIPQCGARRSLPIWISGFIVIPCCVWESRKLPCCAWNCNSIEVFIRVGLILLWQVG